MQHGHETTQDPKNTRQKKHSTASTHMLPYQARRPSPSCTLPHASISSAASSIAASAITAPNTTHLVAYERSEFAERRKFYTEYVHFWTSFGIRILEYVWNSAGILRIRAEYSPRGGLFGISGIRIQIVGWCGDERLVVTGATVCYHVVDGASGGCKVQTQRWCTCAVRWRCCRAGICVAASRRCGRTARRCETLVSSRCVTGLGVSCRRRGSAGGQVRLSCVCCLASRLAHAQAAWLLH